jgi:hypothetical protein
LGMKSRSGVALIAHHRHSGNPQLSLCSTVGGMHSKITLARCSNRKNQALHQAYLQMPFHHLASSDQCVAVSIY